jgi:ribosomal protein S18 acetylase RimI-like enzyme
MAISEVRAAGFEAVTLASSLLQRSRLADPRSGVWEAADVQWWWRVPKRSDEIEQLFWLDDEGPVAGVLLTSLDEDAWQCDPIIVSKLSLIDPGFVWNQALQRARSLAPGKFDVPVSDDDQTFTSLAQQSGMKPVTRDCTAWMDVQDRPHVIDPPEGFSLVDRTQRQLDPHPMARRGGEQVARRLGECPLYDPALDLAIEAPDSRVAGYSLYWFDPVTSVGLVEPVRVEDEFQRRGLARMMLTNGIERLARKGASQIKVSYMTDESASLYQGVGFRQTSTTTWYRSQNE